MDYLAIFIILIVIFSFLSGFYINEMLRSENQIDKLSNETCKINGGMVK